MAKEVFLVTQVFQGCKAFIEELLPRVSIKVINLSCYHEGKFNITDSNNRLEAQDLEQLKTAEIVILDNVFLPDVAFVLPNLKWAQCTFAGLEKALPKINAMSLEKNGETPKFIASRFSGEKYGQMMFEYCLHYIIGYHRGFLLHSRIQEKKDWSFGRQVTPKSPFLLDEITVTVLGVGSIGSYLTKRLKEMGCKTLAFGRSNKSDEFLKESKIDYYSSNIDDVLKETDCIISILPHTSDTVGLLNGRFSLCQRKPIFINMGRGSVVDDTHILNSLDSDTISIAALDVFSEEPLPPDHPFWIHPKVYVTPHISAETRNKDLAELFVKNFERYEKNIPLFNQIKWGQNY